MALPFLPEEEIEPMFQRLQRLQRHASEPLQQFTEYVNDTWINGSNSVCCLGAGVIRTTETSPHVKRILIKG